eukprot:evm.model.NODE_41787_length_35735_cov_26.385588.5
MREAEKAAAEQQQQRTQDDEETSNLVDSPSSSSSSSDKDRTITVDISFGANQPEQRLQGPGRDEREEGEDETFYTLSINNNSASPVPFSFNNSDPNAIGLLAYELVGTQEPLPGMPDVVFRRIRRKELNADESFQRAMGAFQRMMDTTEGGEIERGGMEGGMEGDASLLANSLNPSPLGVNLTAIMLEETDAGKVKDGLLEGFLQSIFPTAQEGGLGGEGGEGNEEVPPLPEDTWQTLRSDVFGKTAGGAFSLKYVVDFDSKFHVMVGEIGEGPSGATLNTQALRQVLEKRLDYFNLTETVSLFFLRFPPETLFELEDIAMDAAMDQFDENGGPPEGGKGDRQGKRGGARMDEEDGLDGLDLQLLGELVPRFLGKLAQGRFAILAVAKRDAPDDSSVLDDPIVRLATMAMGTLLQTSETLRYVSPPLFERLDQDLPGFVAHASEFPALTQGVPPVLFPFLGLIVAHESGHWLAAKRSNMELGPFVPLLDPWFGYFGSLTQLKSYPPTRKAFFDVSAAGPLLGSLVSYAALAGGLWLTKLGVLPSGGEFAPALPLSLLQASTFVAEMTNAFLPGAFAVVDPEHAALTLHPLALAGYWGVMFNALNLLPMGRLDGARMVESLLGKRTASAASTFTFWGTIAAGIWQNRLDLFFAGIVVRLFWYRKAVPCLDEVEEVSGDRYFLGVAGLILMLGALIPATSMFAGDSTYLLNNL